MEEISFRMAREEDRDFIRRLSARVFSIFGDYDEILSQWFLQPGVFTVIGSENGMSIGFAMLQLVESSLQPEEAEDEDTPTGELLAIAVSPEHQGQGVGQAMLSQVEDLAVQFRLGEICLHTAKDNLSAQFLFRKAGYEIIGSKKSYYPQGQSAVMMSKSMSNEQ